MDRQPDGEQKNIGQGMAPGVQRLAEFPRRKSLNLVTVLGAVFTALIFIPLQRLDAWLAPYGIVPFELAFTPARAGEMLRAWGEAGRLAARQSLLLDFAFMPAYALLFSGLTLLAARATTGRWRSLGLRLTLAPFAAWSFDAVENLALLNVLKNGATSTGGIVALAGASATIKFALLMAAWAYTLASAAIIVVPRLGRTRT